MMAGHNFLFYQHLNSEYSIYMFVEKHDNVQSLGSSFAQTEEDFLSSRRNMKIGLPAIYIDPKDEKSENSYWEESESSSKNELATNTIRKLSVKPQILNNKAKEQPRQPIFLHRKFASPFLYYTELLFFVGFIIGSFPQPQGLRYVDLGVSVACFIKIVSVHGGLWLYNRKQQLKCQQWQGQNVESGQPPEQFKIYINKLEKWQLLQIGSLILCILLLMYDGHAFLVTLLSSIKLVRLFFPLLLDFSAQRTPAADSVGHKIKLVGFSALLLLFFTLLMGLFLSNNAHYYCFSRAEYTQQFINLKFNKQELQACSVQSACSNNRQCLNIYSFASTREQKYVIQNQINEYKISSYDRDLWNSYLMTSGGLAIYQKYSQLTSPLLLYTIVLIVWVLTLLWTAISIGQILRFMILKKFVHQNKHVHKVNTNEPPRLSTHPIPVTVSSVSKTQFAEDISQIQLEMSDRSLIHKVSTVLFNFISLVHVVLVICDDLDLGQALNRDINISLGVFFIIWTVGLGLAGYEHIFSPQQNQNSKEENPEKMSRNSIKKYVLLFQFSAYILTLVDYAARIIDKVYIFEEESMFTPFSHAAISLRIIYVLYNNGFDSELSYYTEKMLTNCYNNAWFMGALLIFGGCIGLLEGYLSMEQNFLGFIDRINNSIMMVGGNGGQIAAGWAGIVSFITLQVCGPILGLYIPKRLNLGYGDIFQVKLNLVNAQKQQQDLEDVSFRYFGPGNSIRKFCITLHQLPYYTYFKAAIVLSYGIISVFFIPNTPQQYRSSPLLPTLFAFDLYLIADMLTYMIAYKVTGKQSYSSSWMLFKWAYVVSSVYLLSTFFIGTYFYMPLDVLLRVSRIWILMYLFEDWKKVVEEFNQLLFHPKLKYYKLILVSLSLLPIGLALTARFAVDNSTEPEDRLLIVLGSSISFVYGLGWNFMSPQTRNGELGIVTMNIMFYFLMLYYYVIITFIAVTYFVLTRGHTQNNEDMLILESYSSTDPSFYHHQSVHNTQIHKYLKGLKLILIAASFIIIGLLMSESFEGVFHRNTLASINLFIVFVQICLYLGENILLTKKGQDWPIGEAVLLCLSVPGSFLMIVPTLKYSLGLNTLRLLIAVFVSLSVLRLLRIVPLVLNRQIYWLSSTILRRVHKLLPFKQIALYFMLLLFSLLPFACYIAKLSSTGSLESLLNFMFGHHFALLKAPQVGELIVRLVGSIILLILKTICVAKTISSFIPVRPHNFMVHQDRITQAVVQSGILDLGRSACYAKYNEYYRLSAELTRIFTRFGPYRLQINYSSIRDILRRINIPVFVFTETENQIPHKSYGYFVCDIIYYYYLYHHGSFAEEVKNQPSSLYEQAFPKRECVSKTHFRARSLSILSSIKSRLVHKILKKIRLDSNVAMGPQHKKRLFANRAQRYKVV